MAGGTLASDQPQYHVLSSTTRITSRTITRRPTSSPAWWAKRHKRGVFARRTFAAAGVIERCPVIVVPPAQRERLDLTSLYDYYFGWAGGAAALALGFGSLYNHSADPLARYQKNVPAETVVIVAARDIAAGEEINVSYGRPWFEPVVD